MQDIVRVVCAQSFPGPVLWGCTCVCFVYLGCEQKQTCSYVLYECASSCFRCRGPIYARSRARLSTMFRVFLLVLRPPPLMNHQMAAAGRTGRSAAGSPTPPPNAEVNNPSVRRHVHRSPSQTGRFRWPVVMLCIFRCRLLR